MNAKNFISMIIILGTILSTTAYLNGCAKQDDSQTNVYDKAKEYSH